MMSWRPYRALWQREPRARAYLAASLVDDLGVAVSAWASARMMTYLAETQRARASFMLPALVCFLLGTLLSGPLGDWFARLAPEALVARRWQVVLVGKGIETALLAGLVAVLAQGPPTIARILPYVMVSAFMKTALRSTRIAFSVDLLQQSETSRGDDGVALRDERGEPLEHKTHLLTFLSLSRTCGAIAALGGLLAGGRVMAWAGGRTWALFAFDVLTNLVFLWLIARRCAPASRRIDADAAAGHPPGYARAFVSSLIEGFRFLGAPERRPLLALLAGAWLVEVVSEAYDGKMITKHVLHGSDDAVRYAEVCWTAVTVLGAALLPPLLRGPVGVGRLFLSAMSLDAAAIALAGFAASAREAGAIAPFVAALGVDHGLTLASTTLTDVAQNSASSAAMRGRIAGVYTIAVILGDMASEALAVSAEERWGIPGLLVRAAGLQLLVVAGLAAWGGRRLWRFGISVRA